MCDELIENLFLGAARVAVLRTIASTSRLRLAVRGVRAHAATAAERAGCPAAPATGLLKRYVIVRDIDGIHTKSKQELGAITAASNSALSQTGLDRVQ